MTTLDFRTLFGGSELVVAGRTSDKGIAELGASVEAVADDGKKASYSSKVHQSFPVPESAPFVKPQFGSASPGPSSHRFYPILIGDQD